MYLSLACLVRQTNRVVLFPKLFLLELQASSGDHFYTSTHILSRNTPDVLTASRKNSTFPRLSFCKNAFGSCGSQNVEGFNYSSRT